MRHEHRAPFIASIVVVLACAGVLTHGLRTDALVGLARLAPLRPIAAHVVEPKAVPTEAPQPQAAPALVAAPPAPFAPTRAVRRTPATRSPSRSLRPLPRPRRRPLSRRAPLPPRPRRPR